MPALLTFTLTGVINGCTTLRLWAHGGHCSPRGDHLLPNSEAGDGNTRDGKRADSNCSL